MATRPARRARRAAARPAAPEAGDGAHITCTRGPAADNLVTGRCGDPGLAGGHLAEGAGRVEGCVQGLHRPQVGREGRRRGPSSARSASGLCRERPSADADDRGARGSFLTRSPRRSNGWPVAIWRSSTAPAGSAAPIRSPTRPQNIASRLAASPRARCAPSTCLGSGPSWSGTAASARLVVSVGAHFASMSETVAVKFVWWSPRRSSSGPGVAMPTAARRLRSAQCRHSSAATISCRPGSRTGRFPSRTASA